jgi:hypothetical protein
MYPHGGCREILHPPAMDGVALKPAYQDWIAEAMTESSNSTILPDEQVIKG